MAPARLGESSLLSIITPIGRSPHWSEQQIKRGEIKVIGVISVRWREVQLFSPFPEANLATERLKVAALRGRLKAKQ